jgi:hypothetical protein
MSVLALHRDFDLRRATAVERRGEAGRTKHRGLLRRIFAAVARARNHRIERDAGAFIASHGGRLTDDVERQLDARFSGRPFLPYTLPRAFRPTSNLLDW